MYLAQIGDFGSKAAVAPDFDLVRDYIDDLIGLGLLYCTIIIKMSKPNS